MPAQLTELKRSTNTQSALGTYTINGSRLIQCLDEMAGIGAQPDGSVSRRGFSENDLLGRERVAAWMRQSGLAVRIDSAGNLIGRLEGSDAGLPALMTGSHLDTVPTGGRFDGVLGVLAGLEVAMTVKDRGLKLRHPLEVVVFADEESTMIGCKGMAGTASSDPAEFVTSSRTPIQTNLEKLGGQWSELASARRSDEALAAFLELHVEQGAVLQSRNDVIGVVDGVVGQRRFTISIEGQANHAGTTPMSARCDALAAAAQVILGVQTMALNHPGDPVATVGRIQIAPNAANVVPGSAELTVDLRDLDPGVLDELTETLMNLLERIGETSGCAISLDPQFKVEPTPAHETVQTAIRASADALGLPTSDLPSRASHDAQEMGRRWPMGMIFVPSRDGLSHSAKEFTEPNHCIDGTNVLLNSLLHLDRIL